MKKSKKLWLIIGSVIVIAIAILFTIRVFSGEDDWICVDGKWVQHGHPSAPKPTTICGEQTNNSNDTKKDEIKYPIAETYNVPILMYHYIRNAEGESELGKKLSVSPENFDAQMKWLTDAGYTSIKLADMADPEKKAISKAVAEKKKPIVISFDDGYTDAYTDAFPVLKKYNLTGTFFIIRDSVGYPAYMSQTQIDELATAGMEIGSHSLNHPDLSTADATDDRTQIFDSKVSATVFCYPSGKFNDTVVSLVKEAGYVAAVTTKGGIANQSSDLLLLPRVRIEDGPPITLENKIKAYME